MTMLLFFCRGEKMMNVVNTTEGFFCQKSPILDYDIDLPVAKEI